MLLLGGKSVLSDLVSVCKDLGYLRAWVKEHLGMESRDGDRWLPIVLTARGALYGEVIAQTESMDSHHKYQQPYHLPDKLRQPLYRLAFQLLHYLQQHHHAGVGVYLMQFAMLAGDGDQRIYFDRLIPFPAEPAIASVGVQEPNLFECHWLCLTGQPIRDLTVRPRDEGIENRE